VRPYWGAGVNEKVKVVARPVAELVAVTITSIGVVIVSAPAGTVQLDLPATGERAAM
jgi:hypothetical protein